MYPIAASAAPLESSVNDSSSRVLAEMSYGVAASQPLAADLFSDYDESEDTALPYNNPLQLSAAEPDDWGQFASESGAESAANGALIISSSSNSLAINQVLGRRAQSNLSDDS